MGETVANLDFLTTSFSGLKGGAEAVKKCMKVKEEAESLDDYYYYDYDYYFDDYDYMEEGEGMEVRRKREAGKENKNARRERRRRNRKSKNSKTRSKKASKRNQEKKNKNKKSKRNGKKGKGKNSKNSGKKADKNRKFVNKNPDKTPSKENEEKIKNRLAKLGFTKMPTPSTMSGLECLWDELEN